MTKPPLPSSQAQPHPSERGRLSIGRGSLLLFLSLYVIALVGTAIGFYHLGAFDERRLHLPARGDEQCRVTASLYASAVALDRTQQFRDDERVAPPMLRFLDGCSPTIVSERVAYTLAPYIPTKPREEPGEKPGSEEPTAAK